MADPAPLLIYAANRDTAELLYFEHTVLQCGYRSQRLGAGIAQFSWLIRANWVVEFLQAAIERGELSSECVVIFCDAYDLLLQGGPSEVATLYRELASDRQLIVSAEHGGTIGAPIPQFRKFHELPESSQQELLFVNAGFKVATAAVMLSHFESMLAIAKELQIDDDQILTCHLMNRHPERHVLDSGARICLTAHPQTHSQLNFDTGAGSGECAKERCVRYRGRRPVALHFAGIRRKPQIAMYERSVDHLIQDPGSDRRS